LSSCIFCQVGKWRKHTGKCTHDFTLACTTTVFCQTKAGDSEISVCINAEVCLSCNEGTYQSDIGGTECDLCPLGFYQKLKNKDFCTWFLCSIVLCSSGLWTRISDMLYFSLFLLCLYFLC
jgi:hypothetical protein